MFTLYKTQETGKTALIRSDIDCTRFFRLSFCAIYIEEVSHSEGFGPTDPISVQWDFDLDIVTEFSYTWNHS